MRDRTSELVSERPRVRERELEKKGIRECERVSILRRELSLIQQGIICVADSI